MLPRALPALLTGVCAEAAVAVAARSSAMLKRWNFKAYPLIGD
jgi:hypothetical protein